MSERDGFEPGVPCWIDTWQPDADAAVAFYTALFGWDAAEAPLDDASVRHVMCRCDGRDVAGIGWRPAGEGPDLPTAWGTYIQVADARRRPSRPRPAPAARSSWRRSTASTAGGSRCSSTRAGRCSVCGSSASTAARASSTSPAPGR